MNNDWFLDRFQRSERLSAYWYNKAQDLLGAVLILAAAQEKDGSGDFKAADLGLWESYRFSIALPPVFALNAGLALELLLKSAIVKRDNGPENVPTNGAKGHSLTFLSKELQVVLSDDDAAVLEGFSIYIHWMGRYPVPKSRQVWDYAYRVLERLRKRVPLGPTPTVMISTQNSRRTLNKENFLRLWNTFSEVYKQLPAEKY